MQRRIGALTVAGVVALGTLTSGAALAQSPSRPATPWRIGGGFALTGAESVLDVPAANGALLAVKEINAKGGVLGQPIDLIVHDSQYDMAVTAQTAKQFVEEDKVQAFIGYTDTDSVLASAPDVPGGRHPLHHGRRDLAQDPVPDSATRCSWPPSVTTSRRPRARSTPCRTLATPPYLLSDNGIEYTTLLGEYFKSRVRDRRRHHRPGGCLRGRCDRLLGADHQAQGARRSSPTSTTSRRCPTTWAPW